MVAEVLCLADPLFFINNPREAEIALTTIRIGSELLLMLLAGDKMVTAAGRMAAGVDFIKRTDEAEMIRKAFTKFRFTLKSLNPSELAETTDSPSKKCSPYAIRPRSMLAGWRQDVIDVLPPAP